MIFFFYALLALLSMLIGMSLWSSFRPLKKDGSAKQKAITLGAIALGLVFVWLLYGQLGNAALVTELPY